MGLYFLQISPNIIGDAEIYTSGFLNISGRTGCLGNLGKATSFYDAEGDADVAGLT